MGLITQIALKIASLPISRLWIGVMFTHFSHYLPLDYLKDSENLVAFHHPRPTYPTHILLVPKKAIASLEQLSADDNLFMIELFQCVHDLVRQFDLAEKGYRLVANGGKYQEIPQLHFHLISEG